MNQLLFRGQNVRLLFHLPFKEALGLLIKWIEWALHSEIEPFERLGLQASTTSRAIGWTLNRHLSNAIVEALNTRVRLLTRHAFGSH